MEKKYPEWPGWETKEEIGHGGFGSVYRIERNIFGKIEYAALKEIKIPQDYSDIEEMRSDGYTEQDIHTIFKDNMEAVVSEYSMTRELSGNSNIVFCDDVNYHQRDDGLGWDIFIKMELLTPLTKIPAGEFDENAVTKIGIDITKALELCRKHKIIHRDIKPQNIFRSVDGEYKLGDFGVAKTIERTSSGTKTGTYKYMAPEVYNNQPYGTSADLYSLGLVLYWLLNERRLPFQPVPPSPVTAFAEEESRRRRFSGEMLPPPIHGSIELKKIVLKACEYNPSNRYRTPAEMTEALMKIQKTDSELYSTPGNICREESKISVNESGTYRECDVDELTVGAFGNRDEPDNDKTFSAFGGRGAWKKADSTDATISETASTDSYEKNPSGLQQNFHKTGDDSPQKKQKSRLIIIATAVVVLTVIIAVGIILHGKSDAVSNKTETGIVDDEDSILTAEVSIGSPFSGKLQIAGAEASSELYSSMGITYGADCAVDGDTSTCWQYSENDKESTITVFLNDTEYISDISFNMGFQFKDYYLHNNRPKTIKIEFSTGEELQVELEDTESSQTVTLSKTVQADSFRVSVLDVYEGDMFTDTCISEITVYGNS